MTTVFILYRTPAKLQDLLNILREMEDIDILGDSDDAERALRQIPEKRPNLVLVEVAQNLERHIALIEKIHLSMPRTAFLAFSQGIDSDTVIRTVNAGAKYFLKEPFERAKIREVVDRLLAEGEHGGEAGRDTGKVYAVFSNKGGVGKTTVATNLAVSLALVCQRKVALVDLDLQFGDVSIFLDLHPTRTISDLVSRIRELDPELIRSSLVRHETGVFALTEPRRVEESDLIAPDHIGKIVGVMKTLFDYVVIDTSNSFDDTVIEALELADTILLVSVLDLPTIRNTQRCMEIFRKLDFPDGKVKLVVNRYMSEEEVDPDRFESALKYPVFWKIPNDYSTVIHSINSGVPIQRLSPSSQIARNFEDLARTLTDSPGRGKTNDRSNRVIRRFLSKLSRSKGR